MFSLNRNIKAFFIIFLGTITYINNDADGRGAYDVKNYENILSATILLGLMVSLFLTLYITAEEMEEEVEAVAVFNVIEPSTNSMDVVPNIHIHQFLMNQGISNASQFFDEQVAEVSMAFDQTITYHLVNGGYIIFDYNSLEVIDYEL